MIDRLRCCRTVLVVAPHPDDEAIGAFGLMDQLRRGGAQIWVAVVSDGAASHPGSQRWPPSRLVPERRRETRRAMAMLSIPPGRLRFLGLPDGALAADPATTSRACRRAMTRMPPPDLIVGPHPHDAHADHRAVAAALADRRIRRCPRLGYRVWPLARCGNGRLSLLLDARIRAAKRRAILAYRTQTGRIVDSPTGMTIRPHHLRRFAASIERFEVLA